MIPFICSIIACIACFAMGRFSTTILPIGKPKPQTFSERVEQYRTSIEQNLRTINEQLEEFKRKYPDIQ